MKNRIIFNLVLLVAVFYSPWWLVAILGFIGVFLFAQYYEVIVVGLIMDLLYGAPTLPFEGMLGVIAAVIIFYVATYTRKAVR